MITIINVFVIAGIGWIFGMAFIGLPLLKAKKRATFYIDDSDSDKTKCQLELDSDIDEIKTHSYILVKVVNSEKKS